jgi:hypothetical protein
MTSVAPEQVEPDHADVTHRLCDLCQATEIAQRHPPGLDRRYPTGQVGLDLLLDVKPELGFYFGTDAAPSSDPANMSDESCEHAGSSVVSPFV